ncbi:hypothetical protein SAMN05428996_1469 [Quadrisphaera sp. DSM 44207]|nr:hypothetical protein SAMN05428996_1469 [Quadrisphaera sp. DSM 44207]
MTALRQCLAWVVEWTRDAVHVGFYGRGCTRWV